MVICTKQCTSGIEFGTLLFLIFINDIDEGIVCKVVQFAHDSKVAGVVLSKDDIVQLQKDIRNLYQWSCNWANVF